MECRPVAVVHDGDLSPYVNAISDGLDIESILAETRPRIYTYVAGGESVANFDGYIAEDHECGAIFITGDNVPSWTAEQLCEAIASGDAKNALSMLREGARVNKTARVDGFEGEQTPLRLASHLGHYNIVGMLLLYDAAINFKKDILLRHWSSSVRFRADPDVDALDGTALLNAARGGHEAVVRLLLDNGAEVDVNDGAALRSAAKQGCEAVSRLLLDNGASVNAFEDEALSNAARGGHEAVVRVLLDKGANAGALNSEALRRAASKGHEGVVRLLLDNGADAKANDGEALHDAASKGHENVVRLLLDNLSADVDVPVAAAYYLSFGTALRSAAEGGHEAVVRLLLDKGAYGNARGGAALKGAVAQGHEGIVRLLLDWGANAKALSGDALRDAQIQGREGIVRLLTAKGATFNIPGASAVVPSGSPRRRDGKKWSR